jgi:transaldolase
MDFSGKIKIFCDGATLPALLEMYKIPRISGFTTNPTLMRKAGVKNYQEFALEVLKFIPDRPISFEVFADEFPEMHRQALLISKWSENVYVKVPITNTRGESALPLLKELTHAGVKLNVTALCTLAQVKATAECLHGGAPSIISVFAGRIADTGVDPVPLMATALSHCKKLGGDSVELLWASPRELLNIVQADQIGCDIITVTPDLLKKLDLIGKDLNTYSLETVQMFYNDAKAAGYTL